MSLPERLHKILVKLRECYSADLPDPADLGHSGTVDVRGHMYTTRSSVPLKELKQEQEFTIYLHSRAEDGGDEHLFYFRFEGIREISAIQVMLHLIDGNVRQNVTMSSLPREIFVQMVERRLGTGPPRERGGHRGDQRRSRPRMMPREGGADQRRSRPRMMPREDSETSESV